MSMMIDLLLVLVVSAAATDAQDDAVVEG